MRMTLDEWNEYIREFGATASDVEEVLSDWAEEREMILNELEALREEAEETGNTLAAALGGTLGT